MPTLRIAAEIATNRKKKKEGYLPFVLSPGLSAITQSDED